MSSADNRLIHNGIKHLVRDPINNLDNDQPLKFQIVDWYATDVGDDECRDEIEKVNEENDDHHGDGEKGSGSWTSDRITFRDPRSYEINLFGVTPEGHSVCTRVNNYKPFFYLKLPKKNAKQTAMQLYQLLQKKNYAHKFDYRDKNEKQHFHQWSSGITGMKFLERYDLDAGFTNKEKFSFVEISFTNQAVMKKCVNLIRNIQKPNPRWASQKKKESNDDKRLKAICLNVKLYESNIDSMLRFMHLRDIQSTGWVVLKEGTYQLVPSYNSGKDK